jgi:hypothetical protein
MKIKKIDSLMIVIDGLPYDDRNLYVVNFSLKLVTQSQKKLFRNFSNF